MKYSKVLLSILVFILVIFIFTLSLKNYFIISRNNGNLKVSILNKNIDKDGTEILFNDIIPFDWDKVYTFAPYTSKEQIEEIIGFKTRHISEIISEGMFQLIFVKDEKVVANICGYPSNLLYSIDFYNESSLYNEISKNENAKFLAKKQDDIIYLVMID